MLERIGIELEAGEQKDDGEADSTADTRDLWTQVSAEVVRLAGIVKGGESGGAGGHS